jgi:hypothetical protein
LWSETLRNNAQNPAPHLAIYNQLRGYLTHHVDRDDKPDADVAAVGTQYGGIDTDRLATQIYQRAAGIAQID